jgi:translocation and assembly module TamA
VENYDNIESKLWKSSLSHDHFREWGEYSTYLQYLNEEYEVGSEQGRSSLVLPGLKGSLLWTDNRLVTTRGLRLSASLLGSEEHVLADASFLQGTAGVKAIFSLFDSWRVIGRADGGYTLVDEIEDLPLSLRFFAGGDQSVRGYGYKTIGPRDADGNVIGGKYLFTSSVELERTLFAAWSVAVFHDWGHAANSLSDVDMHAGAGVGLRWNAPFGQIRLDIARALDENGSWRLHFTLGADL